MCKGNVVCFDCRIALRSFTWRLVTYVKPESIGSTGSTRCPHCGELCYFLGPSIPVPKKSNRKAWEKLRTSIMKKRAEVSSRRRKSLVRRKHDLEKQILDLEMRGPSEGRKGLLKKLKSQYEEL